MTFNMQKLIQNAVNEAMKQIEINGMPLENFIMQVEKLAWFLNSEIEDTKERLNDELDYCNPFYDGEYVGNYKTARRLKEKHINICERMLKFLTDKDAN